ncbi:c-type cytochrome [Desulfogranum japonicum]|uniref:c-type cytochrome n=1 Tax=Desulfogranum japonicum TaxID=231447 RepID=UPI0004241E32|nr:c-type cytochrome [Desulfogranum japonicum]
MSIKQLLSALCITLCLCLGVGWVLVFFQSTATVRYTLAEQHEIVPGGNEHGKDIASQESGNKGVQPVFNPPALEDAPEGIREAVLLGYKIMMDTPTYAGEYVGNELSCRNCHFDAGRRRDTISLVGVAAVYPRYRSRREYSADLTLRTQGCFERSMNGTAPPANSQVMQSLKAYYFWISKNIPIYSDIPWLGLRGPVLNDYTPDPAKGRQVFQAVCSRCHGQDGTGTPIAPPLWGNGSFNDGAGMNTIKHFSDFSYRFMPKNGPMLSKEQAMDVAGYAQAQTRPHFVASHPNRVEQVISVKGEE